jgi:fibronectin-binding autotransporter adhesin
MKPKSTLRSFLLLAGSSLLAVSSASAQNLQWDANGTTAGQTNGGGAWLAPNLWYDGAANTTWSPGANAVFGGAATAGGAVTLASPTSVGSITFNQFTGTYTLGTAGQALTVNGGVTLNSTGAVVTFVSPILIGGTQTWSNASGSALTAAAITGTAGTGNTQTITVGSSGAGGITLGGIIGDGPNGGAVALAINNTGTGATTLSGANTFSGGVTLSGGQVANIGLGSYAGFGTGTLTITGGNLHYSNATGTSTIGNQLNLSGSLQFSRAGTGSPVAAFTGNATLAGNFTTTLSATQPVAGVIFSGNIGQSVGSSLSLGGATTYTLSGDNSFSGGLTFSGTTLNINSATALGTGTFTLTSGTLNNTSLGGAVTMTANNAQNWNADLTFTGANSLNMGNGTVTINNNRTVTVSANTLAVGGINQSGGTRALTKNGNGTLAITGSSDYTGTTTVNAGTLNLGGGTAGGSLASPTLTLAGGAFSYTRTGGTTQSFTTTNFNSAASTISVAAGNTLNLGTVTRVAGATIDLTTAGTLAANTSNNVNGFMPGFTIGQAWAVANGADTPITAFADYTLTSVAGTSADNYSSTSNIDVDNDGGAIDAGITVNSLRFSAAAANTLTLTEANVVTGGILVGSSVGGNLSTITGGTLTGAANSELLVMQNNTSAGLTISSVIADNTATSFTKAGAGLLTLAGNNTFTGGLLINAGTVAIGNAGALNNTSGSENVVTFSAGSTGTLRLAGNSIVIRSLASNAATPGAPVVENASSTAATLTVGNSGNAASTFAGVIQDGAGGGALTLVKSGTGILLLSGNANTYSGGTVINAGQLRIVSDASLGNSNGSITLNGGQLLGNNTNPQVGNGGGVSISSARQVTIGAAGGGIGANGNNNFTTTGKLSGSGTFTNFAVSGFGGRSVNFNSLENDFTGGIIIQGSQEISTVSVNSLLDSGNNIIFTNPTWAFGGFAYGAGATTPLVLSNRAFELNSGANALTATIANNNTTHAFSTSQNLIATGSGAKTLILSAVAGPTNVFSGQISNGSDGGTVTLTKTGAGTWAVSGANSYGGITTISAGTLEVSTLANGNANSGIGASPNAASNLVFGAATATLRYTGSGNVTTDRGFTLSSGAGGGATIESSGTGTLSFDNSVAINYGTASQTRNFTLGGTNTGANTFAKTLTDNTSALSFTKTGNGRWILSGTNTYTGTTTVNGGVLQAAVSSGGLPTSSILQLRGGVFQSSGTFSRTVGTAAGNVNWSTSSGGFAAIGGALNLQLNNGTAAVTWNGSSMVQTGQTLIFGSTSADSLVDFQNALNLGSSSSGQRTIQVIDNPGSATDRARISGNISNSAAGWGILKTGDGTLELTGTNSYTGATTVTQGTLSLIGGSQASPITVDGGSLGFTLGSATTSSSSLTFTSGTVKIIGTPTLPSYTLITADGGFSGVPVLNAPVPGYQLVVDGNTLKLDSTGALSPYDTWSGSAAFDADANGDGVSNGLAFLLGAANPGADAIGLLPVVTQSGGNLTLTFSMLDAASRGTATLSVEHSSDLGIADPWTSVTVPDSSGGPTNGVTFTVAPGTPLGVTATISVNESAAGKLFGRLSATE